VDWNENGTNWRLMAKRGERVNRVWNFFGTMKFATNDLTNLEALAAKLKHPPDGVSEYLGEHISPATQTLLASYSGGTNAALERSLVEDLNKIVRRGPLYDKERFAGAKLSPGTASLATRNSEGTELIELNRVLLIEAYPQELSPNSLYSLTLWKDKSHYLDTNMLAMPQFSETPNVFAGEAKFSSRLSAPNAESSEFTIREIREYLQLRPDLRTKDRVWLETQLQGRLATPWSCLVAVLIAIPFGAPSGRRNVFVGVASAIVICFVYFILLRLGLALGTGGILPPWLAAWLPNAVFGITGFCLMLRVR
jgi:hypothetical protein